MDSHGEMLSALVQRILAHRSGAPDFSPGAYDQQADVALVEGGVDLALASEERGGFALHPADVLPMLRAVGGFPARIAVTERLYANWLLSVAELPLARATVAPTTEAASLTQEGSGWRVRASLPSAPWADRAERIVFLVGQGDGVRLVSLTAETVTRVAAGFSLAGEPRDTLKVDAIVGTEDVSRLPEGFGALQWRANGAALRCQMIAGAGMRVMEQTVAYAKDRRQFGQPLARFQAIQQQLAVMAGEVSAATVAADAAARAFGRTPDLVTLAAAKIRCGEAAGQIAAIAHQVHGAIGYAEEHVLHRYTKQLWTWRDDYGREAFWSGWLGRWALRGGNEGLWRALVPGVMEVGSG